MKSLKIKYLGVLLFGVSVFGGCFSEQSDEFGPEMEIRFGARVDSPLVDTKANAGIDYDTDVSLKINLIRWDEGGTMGDVLTGREELPAVMGAPSTASGTWEREITVSPTQFYANRTDAVGFMGWYPDRSDDGWVKDASTGNIISSDAAGPVMTYNIDGTTDVMVSDFEKGTYTTGGPTMQFKHALCMFNIYAYAVDEETKKEWGNVNRITLRNLPQQVYIRFAEDNITTASNIDISYSETSYSYNILDNASYELYAGLPTTASVAHIGTILGGAPSEGVLGVTVVTQKEQSGNSVSIARNFKPGYTYNIFLRFSSKGIINADVSSSKWIYEGNKDYILSQDFVLLTDLSRYGTANSYIVSSANREYCFTGGVKGNGVNVIEGRSETIALPDNSVNLNVDHVKIIRSDAMMELVDGKWTLIEDESRRASIKMAELITNKLSNGKVLFRVLGKTDADGNKVAHDYSLQYKGNLKIAAFDAAGNIIWSWHIWITDKPLNEGYSNGYIAMDRNLGAVTTDYSSFKEDRTAWSGLYYQFGRKDPMFREPIESGNQWSSWTEVDGQEHPAKVAERVSVAQAHSHPMTYYYDTASPEWTTDSGNSANFWGYLSDREDIVKTIYDPCPPGYRVPGNHLWENPPTGMTHTQVSNGNVFAGFLFDFSMINVYYPKTNCIAMGEVLDNDRVGVSGSFDYVYMSSATPYTPAAGETGKDGYAYHFRYNPDYSYSDFLVGDPDGGSSGYHTERSSAYPVRCVFENSSPVITDLSEAQTANCYIVEESGFYEFDATVRGNGVTRLNVVGVSGARDFDAGLGSNITNIDHIDVLWWQGDLVDNSAWRNFVMQQPETTWSNEELQAYCNENCPVVVMDGGRLVDGKPLIYVRVNKDTYGNVGLAAYDANDNIVWSWHIWIMPDIELVSLGDYTLMDRNLGATFAPTASLSYSDATVRAGLGFFYQWGRKDPFFQPGGITLRDSKNIMAYAEKTDDGWVIHRYNRNYGGIGTIQESIANPLKFFNAPNTNYNAWQTTYPSGGSSAINDLWGYVGASGFQGNSFAKTMWDPCPPGYRVMQHNVFLSANIAESDLSTIYTFNNTNANAIYFDDNTYIYGRGYAKSSGIWFPNCGFIENNGNFQMTGSGHKMWTATPFSGEATRIIGWTIRGTSRSISQQNDCEMSRGLVVRCQME